MAESFGVLLDCYRDQEKKSLVLAQPHLPGCKVVAAARHSEVALIRVRWHTALVAEKNIAAETLGHIDYKEYAVSFAAWLAEKGQAEDATRVLNDLYQTLSDRRVLERVLQEIMKLHDEYGAMQGKTARRSKPA